MRFVALAIVSSSVVAACIGPDGVPATTDARSLIGYYLASAPNSTGDLVYLDLRRDLTYEAGMVKVCIVQPCDPKVQTGAWHAAGTDLVLGMNHFEFASEVADDGALTTTLVRDGATQVLHSKGPVICGPELCDPGYVCCNESCGTCLPPDRWCSPHPCS